MPLPRTRKSNVRAAGVCAVSQPALAKVRRGCRALGARRCLALRARARANLALVLGRTQCLGGFPARLADGGPTSGLSEGEAQERAAMPPSRSCNRLTRQVSHCRCSSRSAELRELLVPAPRLLAGFARLQTHSRKVSSYLPHTFEAAAWKEGTHLHG